MAKGVTTMTTKQELHHLVDELPDQALPEAARRLEPLRDPVLASMLTAPIDDEPETAEEREGIAEARADDAAGRVISQNGIEREFGRCSDAQRHTAPKAHSPPSH